MSKGAITRAEVKIMIRDFKRLSAVVVGCLIATSVTLSAPAMAADYPPSITVLEVGKPLINIIAPRNTGTTAVVPVATSGEIPIIIGEPIKVSSARLSTKFLTNASVESTPLRLSSSLTLGGIGADEKAPVATISRTKNSEVQIPVDVPTRIVLTGFKPSATGTVSFVGSNGAGVSLGKIKVSSTGRVTIPALTFAKKYASYTIKVTINGATTSFIIRATA
jgi:hypothetical protein